MISNPNLSLFHFSLVAVFYIVGDFYSQHLDNMLVKATGDKLNSDGLGSGSLLICNHTHSQYHLEF